MSETAIAPAAQRLAEDNNVDWRSLSGSGDGGEVTERDVLEHLARVMRGEAAVNPTPEPVPEGISAWPEELEPQRAGRDLFSAAFTPASPKPDEDVRTEAEPEASPWQVDTPTGSDLDLRETNATTFRIVREPPPEEKIIGVTPWGAASPTGAAQADALTPDQVSLVRVSSATPEGGVSEAVYQATVTELEALRARLARLEEERLRHVGELHQLSRMQETIALQKNEGAKLMAAQSEMQRLKTELERARGEARQGAELEARNRDLEERLTRARTFRERAKAEYERLIADNMMLEHELANLKKRQGWKFWKR